MSGQFGSPASSGSSSFDPYSADMPTETENSSHGQEPSNIQQPLGGNDQTLLRPLSTESAGSNPSYPPPEFQGQGTSADFPPRKRKRPETGSLPVDNSSPFSIDTTIYKAQGPVFQSVPGYPQADRNKRVKFDELGNTAQLPQDKSKLPGELWQHIFTFLPPISLGRVLQVNRSFRGLLTGDQSELSAKPTTPGSLQYVTSSSIWSISRKTFHPGMPRPLGPLSEQDMWNLVCGTACQFCKKPGSILSPTESSPWESGPGPNGVRIIWPFGVRSCGECLQLNCDREMDILFSSTLPSLLVPAIPFAFFTSSMHFVSSVTLRSNQPPSGLALTKYFLKSQAEEMKSKFEEVKSLGSGTAEEWVKGLEGNGKEKIADAARWEQWELTGGLRSVLAAFSQIGQDMEPTSHHPGAVGSISGTSSPPNMKVSHRHGKLSQTSNANGSNLPTRPLSAGAGKSFSLPVQTSSHHRSERSIREVNEAKASRKSEIERRCAELDPPLTPMVLSHMDSFSAAIQIPHPFTDRDWEILKPRLLSQRDMAERREYDRIKQDKILQAKSDERRQQEAQLKEAKELLDREWDDVQKPIRDRMVQYADEIIREGWRGGDGVTKEKSPKFAADVLMYVRDRFYSDLAKEDAVARSAGKPIEDDPPNGPPTRKLILENMKFIFDIKIKPLTDQFQKELFLCNGCENNSKFYGFEGVVQHYAAKHTNVLSLGSVVVHWRAEWPEHPPFHPNPNAAKALLFAMPRPTMGQPSHGYPSHPQMSPAPYRRTPYTPYAYGSGPYRPPSPAGSQFYPGQQGGYSYSPQQPGYPPSGPYDQHGPPPPPNPVYSPYPGPGYPPPYSAPDGRPPHPSAPYQAPPYGPQPPAAPPYGAPFQNNPHGNRQGGRQSNKSNPNSQAFGFYQTQLDDIAKNARSVWNGTSGIKDLPHNVRAHVLIHHVVGRFVESFGHEPPQSLFAEGLNNHPQMKPIRNLSGLICKACADNTEPRRTRAHDSNRGDRKMYTLPALVSHFQSMHSDPQQDWKVHMLSLPDVTTISSLTQAPGMDQAKFHLIAPAFPWVFPPAGAPPRLPLDARRPGPKESKHHQAQNRRAIKQEGSMGGAALGTKPSVSDAIHAGLEVAVDNFPSFVDSPGPDGTRPFEPPKDDEYDPHRPAFVEPIRDQYGRVDRRTRTKVLASTSAQNNPDETARAGHELPPMSSKSAKLEYNEPAALGTGEERHGDTARPERRERNVSEDGEVSEPRNAPGDQTAGEPPTEELSAAERFLSSFVPGQERDEYNALPSEPNRQTDPSAGIWRDAPDTDVRRRRAEGNAGGTAESSLGGTPTQGGKHSGRGGRTRTPAPTRGYRDFDTRLDVPENNPGIAPRHGSALSPDPTDPRHPRRGIPFSETRQQPDPSARRPQSRFDRYEAQRQGSLRPRSRSPAVHDAVMLEQGYYRERSPRARPRQRPSYAEYAPDPYAERVPIDQPTTYTRMPTHSQYQYVEDPRYPDRQYDSTVEYIPVRVAGREPQQPSYIIERPVHRDMPKEYVDYEMDYSRQPVYEDPGQYYPPEGVPRHSEVPAPVPRRARYR